MWHIQITSKIVEMDEKENRSIFTVNVQLSTKKCQKIMLCYLRCFGRLVSSGVLHLNLTG